MAHRQEVEIDERTKYIVFGFIRQIEYTLSFSHHNQQIPPEISLLILSYVSDHFMLHIGTFEWRIKQNQLSEMLNSSNKQQFVSELFEIGGLQWIIQAYPNGIDSDSIGLFDIFVKLLSLPPKWDHIIVRRTIECIESHSKYTCIATYEKDSSFGWCDGALSLAEIIENDYKCLTFVISITILRIQLLDKILYEINSYESIKTVYDITWQISPVLMHKMQQSNTGKCYESNIANPNGLFCIQCFPNGDNSASKGDVELYIQLCALPHNISKLEIEYTLKCTETQSRDTRTKEFDYDNDQSAKWSHDVLSFSEFNKYESLTFEAEICIKNKYDLKGDLVSDVNSDWNWYLAQIKYFREISRKNKQNNLSQNKKELQCIKAQITQVLTSIHGLQRERERETKCACSERSDEIELNFDNELYVWLKDIVGLEQYFHHFVRNGFEGLECIKYITNIEQLNCIGVAKLGHRLKLMDYITQMIQSSND